MERFGYDAENRLLVATNFVSGVPTTKTDFSYDGMSRLRKRLESTYSSGGGSSAPGRLGPGSSGWTVTNETRYIYDGMREIQERDSNNVPVVSYTRGSDLSAPLLGGAGGGLEGAGGIGGLLARSPPALIAPKASRAGSPLQRKTFKIKK